MKKLLFLLAFPSFALAQVHDTIVYKSVTPVVDTSVYAAGDCIGGAPAGSCILTFTDVGCGTPNGEVASVMIDDNSNNTVGYEVYIFKSSPTGTFTDQLPINPANADLRLMFPPIEILSTDHWGFVTNGVSSLASLTSSGPQSTKTWYVAISPAAGATYATSGAVTVTLGVRCL